MNVIADDVYNILYNSRLLKNNKKLMLKLLA